MLPRVPDSTLSFPAAPALSTGINYCGSASKMAVYLRPACAKPPGSAERKQHVPHTTSEERSQRGAYLNVRLLQLDAILAVICTTAAALPLTDGRPIVRASSFRGQLPQWQCRQ
uniref:Uncharacterized protein n=1 Tax=Anopheles merus TaxID=30066 RepID=A0A182VPB9_ANOME